MTKAPILTALPLFPLHTVLFPGGMLPLRIFEPRYLHMVRRCRSQHIPFGVVTLTQGEETRRPGQALERFHPVGTMAQIERIHYQSNGLALLRCSGHGRFRVIDARLQPHGLWVADVQLLPSDVAVPVPPDQLPTAQALAQVMRKYTPPTRPATLTTGAATGEPADWSDPPRPEQYDDCGWVANRWCEVLPMHDRLRLQLLEQDSPLLRLELITDALECAGMLP